MRWNHVMDHFNTTRPVEPNQQLCFLKKKRTTLTMSAQALPGTHLSFSFISVGQQHYKKRSGIWTVLLVWGNMFMLHTAAECLWGRRESCVEGLSHMDAYSWVFKAFWFVFTFCHLLFYFLVAAFPKVPVGNFRSMKHKHPVAAPAAVAVGTMEAQLIIYLLHRKQKSHDPSAFWSTLVTTRIRVCRKTSRVQAGGWEREPKS